MAREKSPNARNQVETEHPQITQRTDRSPTVSEQPHEAIGKSNQLLLVVVPPTGVALEEQVVARINFAACPLVDYAIAQRRNVPEPEVEALRRHRVQTVGRIADEDCARRDESARLAERQRIRGANADPRKTTESPAECVL